VHRIRKAAVINNWNLDRGIQQQSKADLAWKAVTTGSYGAIDLWLETPNVGSLNSKAAQCPARWPLPTSLWRRAFRGGLERALQAAVAAGGHGRAASAPAADDQDPTAG